MLAAGVAAIFSSLSSEAGASTITWNLPGDGDWDIFSPNWSGDATVFQANGTVDVNFNTSANTTITVGINMGQSMGQSMGQAMLALQPPVVVESGFETWQVILNKDSLKG